MAQSPLQAVVLWAATSVHRWVKPAAPILPPQVPGSPPASCGGVPGGGQLGGQCCRTVPGQLVPGWRVKVPKLGEGCCLAPAPSPAPRRTALGTPSGHPSKQRLGRAEGAGKSGSPPAPPGHGYPEPVQQVQAPGAALGRGSGVLLAPKRAPGLGRALLGLAPGERFSCRAAEPGCTMKEQDEHPELVCPAGADSHAGAGDPPEMKDWTLPEPPRWDRWVPSTALLGLRLCLHSVHWCWCSQPRPLFAPGRNGSHRARGRRKRST